MSPPFRFEVSYDDALVRRAAWSFARRRVGRDRRLWAAFMGGEIFAFGWAWGFDEPWMIAFGLGFPVLVAVLFVAVWRSHRAAALTKLRALDAGQAAYTIDEIGLTVATRAGSSTIVWDAIDEVWTYPGFWIVVLAVNGYFTLPTSAAPPDALTYMRGRIGRVIAG